MKANLTQQAALVHALQATTGTASGTNILRRWLEQNGYEAPEMCQHYAVIRATGKCSACGKQVIRP